MRGRRTAAALTATLLAGLATPAAAAPTYTYPPTAPAPTAHAKSPGAPDPHPPAGGLTPKNTIAGGPRLAHRGLVLPEGAPKLPPHLTARAWVLVDLDSGDILAARDPHGRYQPASILKLLTSVTLIPRLDGTRRVVATKQAANTEGSHAGLVANGRYTVDDLFDGLLLVSGNDTAVALAQAAGGVRHTVALMNEEALRLGAYDTYVETPSGLDGWKQLTSAYDMALILRAALAQPRFSAYDRTLRAFLPKEPIVGRVELDNQNALFLQTVPGALVAKTGYTDAAQHTYVAAVRRHGRRLGVVFLRNQRWPLDQWQQAVELFRWADTLPAATTPVGRLDGPVTVAGKLAPKAKVAAASAARRSLSTGSATHTTLVILAGTAFALVLAAGWWAGRSRPRRAARR